jgi:hypothetical protein
MHKASIDIISLVTQEKNDLQPEAFGCQQISESTATIRTSQRLCELLTTDQNQW